MLNFTGEHRIFICEMQARKNFIFKRFEKYQIKFKHIGWLILIKIIKNRQKHKNKIIYSADFDAILSFKIKNISIKYKMW